MRKVNDYTFYFGVSPMYYMGSSVSTVLRVNSKIRSVKPKYWTRKLLIRSDGRMLIVSTGVVLLRVSKVGIKAIFIKVHLRSWRVIPTCDTMCTVTHIVSSDHSPLWRERVSCLWNFPIRHIVIMTTGSCHIICVCCPSLTGLNLSHL